MGFSTCFHNNQIYGDSWSWKFLRLSSRRKLTGTGAGVLVQQQLVGLPVGAWVMGAR
eukprot:SAG31_NODE_22184_length_532_cov_0.658199_1_plen_57_part_00